MFPQISDTWMAIRLQKITICHDNIIQYFVIGICFLYGQNIVFLGITGSWQVVCCVAYRLQISQDVENDFIVLMFVVFYNHEHAASFWKANFILFLLSTKLKLFRLVKHLLITLKNSTFNFWNSALN